MLLGSKPLPLDASAQADRIPGSLHTARAPRHRHSTLARRDDNGSSMIKPTKPVLCAMPLCHVTFAYHHPMSRVSAVSR